MSRRAIDLFDDPSWTSEEGQEEAAAYQWVAVSGFSVVTERLIVAIWLALYVIFFVLAALVPWAFGHMFDGLNFGWPSHISFPLQMIP